MKHDPLVYECQKCCMSCKEDQKTCKYKKARGRAARRAMYALKKSISEGKEMSKKFNEQLMKFEITKEKLKMEISLKDLAWLFENSPNNYGSDGEGIAKVKRGKRQEFAEFIVNGLLDDVDSESNNTVWIEPFENIFMQIFEGAEDDFIKYPDEEDEV